MNNERKTKKVIIFGFRRCKYSKYKSRAYRIICLILIFGYESQLASIKLCYLLLLCFYNCRYSAYFMRSLSVLVRLVDVIHFYFRKWEAEHWYYAFVFHMWDFSVIPIFLSSMNYFSSISLLVFSSSWLLSVIFLLNFALNRTNIVDWLANHFDMEIGMFTVLA